MTWQLRILSCVCVLTLWSTLRGEQTSEQRTAVVYLEQGWSQDERQEYYYRPQGSELLPYDWFLALEQPFADRPFRAPDYIERFRYIPNAPNPYNPDGLPVGFTKSVREGKAWMGMTCAACHTGQISYRGTQVRIDGGSGLPDIVAFEQAVADAVRATLESPAKFERFAAKVNGNDRNADDKLRAELRERLEWLDDWAARNRPAFPSGFGRWDALNVAFNDVAAVAISEPSNFRTPLAPASYPCIWLTTSLEKVLWNGSVENTLSRSMGEAIIAFGRLHISEQLKFSSTVSIPELEVMYHALADLQPPRWPEAILGAIDSERAARGAKIYERENCTQCHGNKAPYPMTEPNQYGVQFIKAVTTPLEEVGTDPVYATQFLERQAVPGIAAPLLKGTVFEGSSRLPASILFLGALKEFTNVQLDELGLTAEQRLAAQGFRDSVFVPTTQAELQAITKQLTAYKTQPLAGIWATAPYLHNGSVPNLYELLLPPEQRSKKFYVGSREFDPKKVGYVSGPSPGAYEFDASVLGNSNSGHTYGTTITEEERWDLIEYLKTL